jgi:hypothetical protein
MARQLNPTLLLSLMLAGVLAGQPAQPPAAGNSRIYILLKPSVASPGDARDAFSQRMAALGAINLQFVTGANAARCDAPAAAQTAIGADQDVSGVLPVMDAAAPGAPGAPSPSQAPVFTTPPYIPPQQPMPYPGNVPMGSGMSAGMAMLTDFAGNMLVKLLAPGTSCKIRLQTNAPAIPASGGAGAFEVKATGNCAWQAVSTADWLQVKTEVNATGTVTMVYTAARNTGEHRQAVVVIQPVAGMAPLKGHTVMLVVQQ